MSILKDPPVPFILINGWLVMCTPSSAVWRLQVDSGPADPVSGVCIKTGRWASVPPAGLGSTNPCSKKGEVTNQE